MKDTDIVKTENYKDHTIKIVFDTDYLNPRTDWDCFGNILAYHSKYDLGDMKLHDLYSEKHECKYRDLKGNIDFKELEQVLIKEQNAVIILPLELYDHSGITIKVFTGTRTCRFDSSIVGYAYVTKEQVIKEYGKVNKKNLEKAEKLLRAELETYDNYLTGQVYGFQITDNEENDIESCYGFYGYDSIEGMITECKKTIDYAIKENKEKADYEAKLILNEDTLVY